jgi:polyhydroxyalkanoate synthesis repressor PhaR
MDTAPVRIRIKRYANRKLYNTETSRYITLRGISDLLRQGREVEVVDNETGHDISSLVFSRMLVDEERSMPPLLESGAVLGEVVQRQLTSLYTLLRRYAGDMQDNLMSGLRENVRRWVQSAAAPDGAAPPDGAAAPGGAWSEELLRKEIEAALARMNLASAAELAQVQDSLSRLAASIERIEQRLPARAEVEHTS